MPRNLSKAWKVASIATTIASLFFFSIFFFYMIFGYTIYLLEPVPFIASLECCLCLSALTFQLKSLKLPKPQIIFKYPLISLAVVQYLDVLSTILDKMSGRGYELNPFYYYLLPLKLAFFPAVLVLIQIYWYKYLHPFRYIINALLIIYLIVVVSNFLGAFGL